MVGVFFWSEQTFLCIGLIIVFLIVPVPWGKRRVAPKYETYDEKLFVYVRHLI